MATKKVILYVDKLKMARVNESDIPKTILSKIEGRESFTDSDLTLGERIFSANIFCLKEQEEIFQTLSEGEKQELQSIYEQVEKFDYILLGRV